jgi:hypothetical protein
MAADLNPFRLGTLAPGDALRASMGVLNDPAIRDAAFPALTTELFNQILSGVDEAAMQRIYSSALFARVAAGAAAVPAALDTFIATMADYAKCHTPASAVQSQLEGFGLGTERASVVAAAYSTNVEAIRKLLAGQGA